MSECCGMCQSGDGISIVNIGLTWLIGQLLPGNVLSKPKIYVFNAKQHGIMSLPGSPEEMDVSQATFCYALPDGEVKDLYVKSFNESELVVPPDNIVTLS
jgi:hypothetical protein